jgi:hypothetical protein
MIKNEILDYEACGVTRLLHFFLAAARPYSSTSEPHCGDFKQSQLMPSLYEKLLPQVNTRIMKLHYFWNFTRAVPDTVTSCSCWWQSVRCLSTCCCLAGTVCNMCCQEGKYTEKYQAQIQFEERRQGNMRQRSK